VGFLSLDCAACPGNCASGMAVREVAVIHKFGADDV
jgi:hypothetical protein